MKCKSSFAAGGPGSPLSETRSAREGCSAPVGANPEDGVGVPRPAPRPGRSNEGGPGARETQVQLRPERGGAQDARRSPASPRVQVHPRVGARRGSGSEFSLLGLGSGVPCAPLLRGPHSVTPLRPRWAAGLERKPRRTDGTGTPGALLLFPSPDPQSGRPPRPTRRLRLEKKFDFLSTLLRVEPGMGRKLLEHAACAFATRLALLKRSSSHQSLASPPPRKPRAGL